MTKRAPAPAPAALDTEIAVTPEGEMPDWGPDFPTSIEFDQAEAAGDTAIARMLFAAEMSAFKGLLTGGWALLAIALVISSGWWVGLLAAAGIGLVLVGLVQTAEAAATFARSSRP
jgi:hypothetical protein